MQNYHGNLPCKITMENYHGKLPWKITMENYHGKIPWSISMVNYHGQFPWSISMVNYHGKSSWFITMVSCHELVPRTFAAKIWEILIKNFFSLKIFFCPLKFRSFSIISISDQNSDFGQNIRFLTKGSIF